MMAARDPLDLLQGLQHWIHREQGEATAQTSLYYVYEIADIDCLAPFELRRAPGQCCPVCFATDEEVALDRHTALQGKNPYLVDAAAAAPTTCGGVKCFKPHCFHGYSKGFVQGRCCESCVAR